MKRTKKLFGLVLATVLTFGTVGAWMGALSVKAENADPAYNVEVETEALGSVVIDYPKGASVRMATDTAVASQKYIAINNNIIYKRYKK